MTGNGTLGAGTFLDGEGGCGLVNWPRTGSKGHAGIVLVSGNTGQGIHWHLGKS
jgi:hypothetical protein